MLTTSDATTAKKVKAVSKTVNKAVAATSSTIEPVDSDEEISATAAILPDSPGEYNSDSDEDWDVSHHEVSLPICGKHLVWECQVHSMTEDFPVKTCALIDNGMHLVLIHPELVSCLGFKKYRLQKPELVDVTFNNQKSKTKLYHYVKLSLTSLDCTWTSLSIKAIITPGLCAPIILGLPLLDHNSIITDHCACTCIDKKTSYDLLNPVPVVLPPPPKPKFCEQIKNVKADKKLVLVELLMVCNDRIKHLKLPAEEVKDFDVAGAVHEHIERLAAEETLMKCEKKLRTEYKIIFEPIPHVN